ncbi:unnamed protein product [Gongylonema pulchrum]|uniref:Transcription initiation factor TFIID subunit 12 n=1 Tax=Gongylonema pulchrum TaxID=637853 RepID=A0A183DPT5_9BILA|nr:unnamed protein product [Gongylonema pulchrum]
MERRSRPNQDALPGMPTYHGLSIAHTQQQQQQQHPPLYAAQYSVDMGQSPVGAMQRIHSSPQQQQQQQQQQQPHMIQSGQLLSQQQMMMPTNQPPQIHMPPCVAAAQSTMLQTHASQMMAARQMSPQQQMAPPQIVVTSMGQPQQQQMLSTMAAPMQSVPMTAPTPHLAPQHQPPLPQQQQQQQQQQMMQSAQMMQQQGQAPLNAQQTIAHGRCFAHPNRPPMQRSASTPRVVGQSSAIRQALGHLPPVQPAATLHSDQQPRSSTKLLDKEAIDALVKAVDPMEAVEDDVSDVLVQLIEEFVDDLIQYSARLTKNSPKIEAKDVQFTLQRKYKMNSPKIEAKDVQFTLQRKYKMFLSPNPGSQVGDPNAHAKSPATEAHRQRMALIKKVIQKP